jgi:hypothetical protein
VIVVDGPIHLEEGDFGPRIVKLSRNLTITSDLAGPHQVSKGSCTGIATSLSNVPFMMLEEASKGLPKLAVLKVQPEAQGDAALFPVHSCTPSPPSIPTPSCLCAGD